MAKRRTKGKGRAVRTAQKGKKISPQEANMMFARFYRTQECNAFLRKLFPEGIAPLEQEVSSHGGNGRREGNDWSVKVTLHGPAAFSQEN